MVEVKESIVVPYVAETINGLVHTNTDPNVKRHFYLGFTKRVIVICHT